MLALSTVSCCNYQCVWAGRTEKAKLRIASSGVWTSRVSRLAASIAALRRRSSDTEVTRWESSSLLMSLTSCDRALIRPMAISSGRYLRRIPIEVQHLDHEWLSQSIPSSYRHYIQSKGTIFDVADRHTDTSTACQQTMSNTSRLFGDRRASASSAGFTSAPCPTQRSPFIG